MRNRVLAVATLLAIGAVGALSAHASQAQTGLGGKQHRQPPPLNNPASSPAWPSQLPQQLASTPIKHLVVLFQENVSFDHYFGTYPNAVNPVGEPQLHAAAGTPSVNGLGAELLTDNPNLSNPQRLDRSQAHTCDQDHGYTAEQEAFDHGLMDRFVQDTGRSKTVKECTGIESGTQPNYAVMDYYDGNTVTGLWNYAQDFAMSDNSFGTGFGPSSPGAINVTAGNSYGVVCGPSFSTINAPECPEGSLAATTPGETAPQGPGTMYSDEDPYWDVCSYTEDGEKPSETAQMGGKNVGDLLDEQHVTWGWFQGGFASPGYLPGKATTDDLEKVCSETHKNIAREEVNDYIPHHEPFQYYASTANPQHLPPTSITMIGRQDQANHQYDIRDFWAAADAGNMPAVSYVKAPAYEDGHAGYSDPLDEQRYLAEFINRLEKLPTWSSTAVVINWDDSDGWYDHQIGPIVRQSQTALDALTGTGECGSNPLRVPLTEEGAPEQGRCGVGPRLPLLVVSPYAKSNYVDDMFTTQTSIVRFIEDNWLGGQRIGGGSADATTGSLEGMFNFHQPPLRRLFLDPETGEPATPRFVAPIGTPSGH
ncbi:MAG: phospholipase C [Solirubrobacteraceae bacterium]